MNEIINKSSLAGDRFILEMHLRQPAFPYSACELLNQNKDRTKKFKETKDSRNIF